MDQPKRTDASDKAEVTIRFGSHFEEVLRTKQVPSAIFDPAYEELQVNLEEAKKTSQATLAEKKAPVLEAIGIEQSRLLEEYQAFAEKEKARLANQLVQLNLVFKRRVLTELFEMAEAEMVNWSETEQLAFFKQAICDFPEPVEVQFGQLTAATFSASTWASLIASYPQVTFNRQFIPQEGGFRISRGRVDSVYIYSELLARFQREEEHLIAADLFPKEKTPPQKVLPWFMRDKTLTPQERHEARLDWRENEKRMRELKAHLAKPFSYTITPKEPPKKTKEERIEELRRKENALQEAEDQLGRTLKKLEAFQEACNDRWGRGQGLLADLSVFLPSKANQAMAYYDQHQQGIGRCQGLLDEQTDAYQKAKRQTIEDKEVAYYDRLKLIHSEDDEGDDDQ